MAIEGAIQRTEIERESGEAMEDEVGRDGM